MLKFDYRIVTIWWFFFSLITRFRRPDGLIYYYNDLGFFAQSWFTFTYYIGIPPYKFRIKSPSPRHRKHRADVLSASASRYRTYILYRGLYYYYFFYYIFFLIYIYIYTVIIRDRCLPAYPGRSERMRDPRPRRQFKKRKLYSKNGYR